MLGRLIQGYTRGGQLESATDETHTRSLLWPEPLPDPRSGSVSPPTTPFGSPVTRVSPFDDRAGLELSDTRDLRLVVAQDAFGTNDHPLLLFDTQASESADAPSSARASGSNRAEGLSSRTSPVSPALGHVRNRSSTMSGASTSWTRPSKESEATDHLSNVLACMFGASSTTKAGSSTKMHFLPGDKSPASDLSPRAFRQTGSAAARAPFLRSRTALNTTSSSLIQNAARGSDSEPSDAVLVTRMFPVTLPETQDDVRQHRTSSAGQGSLPAMSPDTNEQQDGIPLPSKKPKLVEKKTPVFAIGLICYLPRPGDIRPGTSSARPPSRASYAPSVASNSQGSGSFSSWTLLNAIPEHLWTEEPSTYITDRGIETIVQNWDVILRSLGVMEAMARSEIGGLLQEVNFALMASAAKAPKGPFEQRTNQRNVYLRSPNRLAKAAELQRGAKHTLWRISYALRVPRVQTGLGLENGGHWLDEARYLVRLCGAKQHNFFLFNLLTAFLGNHTEWLEKLGPDWYRKQFRAMNKGKPQSSNLASRTVIVCENRSMARRIIFLLASFLPRNTIAKHNADFLSPLLTPDISSSSPNTRLLRDTSIRRHPQNKSRDQPFSFPRRDLSEASASLSSSESVSAISRALQESARSAAAPGEPDSGPGRHASVLALADGSDKIHKTHATSSTATPGAGTPVPHFATRTDSYFPEGAIVDDNESGASADLARILRRDSTSHSRSRPPSINWGSLVNGVSGMWNQRRDSTSSSHDNRTSNSGAGLSERRRLAPKSMAIHSRAPSQLETMVGEATHLPNTANPNQGDAHPLFGPSSHVTEARPPQMTVDKKDGVIDVDLNLPGFMSWPDGTISSPAMSLNHQSPSYASTDGGASSQTSRSHSLDAASPNSVNVAGYLKRYHEDFTLQGVKGYPELQDEIKESMSREATPAAGSVTSDSPTKGEQWMNVCTTLLADFRTFSIQRITLKRRVRGHIGASTHGSGSHTTVQADGSESSTDSSKATLQPGMMHAERFVSEAVMDFDTTLTDAIERVVSENEAGRQKSGAALRTHSRNVSSGTTASIRSLPVAISSSAKDRPWSNNSTMGQTDCRQAVVGALENVVKSVNDDLAKHHRNRDAKGQLQIDGDAINDEMKQDNVLREGVKKWLLNVETRSVW
jgi:hypothetical protein